MASIHPDKRRGTRSRFVGVKFTPDEHHRVLNFATTRDLTVAALVRASVLDAVTTEHVPRTILAAVEVAPEASSQELVDLRAEINRVGTNINQIARLSNQRGVAVIPNSDGIESFTAMLGETLGALHAVQDALGGSVRAF